MSDMIGQNKLIERIDNLIENNKFPRFTIITGLKGSGKKTLVDLICDKLQSQNFSSYILADNKVDSVREMTSNVYQSHNMIYVMRDADDMSLAAKNAILKVVEECPNNNLFIMTLEDIGNTLDTIKSRATIFNMSNYSSEELVEYATKTDLFNAEEIELVKSICETPGEIDVFSVVDINEFYSYVQKVIDNIATAPGYNVFKIADRVVLKDKTDVVDEKQYDLKMFWKAFIEECHRRELSALEDDTNKEDALLYLNWIKDTMQAVNDLRVKGINRQQLFDCWILKIREDAM